jgi:hypothetical protein
MATTYYNQIQQLYVAYFNRPADPDGLAYWETVVENSKAGADAALKAITAQFAKEPEYTKAFANMSNGEIVDKIYLNMFGRAADADGKAYWVGLLDSKKVTIDRAVADIAAAAKNQDLVTINNKVAASVAFTAALDTQAEKDGYKGDAAAAIAKTFLAGITDAASFAAATAPATLNATVAKAVAAGTPFTLTSGLAALQSATDAKAAFLDAADGKADGKFGTGTDDAAKAAAETKIGTDVTTKTATVAGLVTVAGGDYAAASTTLKAALLAEQVAANQKALTTAQTEVSDANVAIAKVAGLSAAVTAQTSAKASVDAAVTAQTNAKADLAAKGAAYASLNSLSAAPTVATNGTVTGVIVLNSSGKLALATGVTETTNPGVTALLASINAKLAADATVTAANQAYDSATDAVHYLDMGATEKTDLQAIATAMKNVTVAEGALPTTAQITTEQTILQAKVDAAVKADADYAAAHGDTHDAALAAAVTTANGNKAAFTTLVNTYHTDYVADALVTNLGTANSHVDTAAAKIKALTDAVTAMNKAMDLQTQLVAVNGTVTAANKAFTDNSLALPVTASGTMIANVGSDIYVAGKSDATIALFGLQGSDALYIGSQFSLNATGDVSKGNDSLLEAFIVADGTNTKIVLETKAFSSNSSDAEITITLTGVDATKVHLNNGIITVS